MDSKDSVVQRIRRHLPLSFRYWLAEGTLRRRRNDLNEQCERKIRDALRNPDSSRVEAVLSEYREPVSQARKQLDDIRLRRFLALADRWNVYVPNPPGDSEVVEQEKGQILYCTRADTVGPYSGWGLTPQARSEILKSIRQARHDSLQYWATWITMLTGLIGVLIGLVSVLNKK